MEIWKPIKGTDGNYEISSMGRVRSNITNKVLKIYVNSAGYKRLWIYEKGGDRK